MSFDGNFNKKYTSNNFHSFEFLNIILFNIIQEIIITSYAGDCCIRDNIRTKHNLTKKEIYDHQFITCDPNLYHYN